MKHYHLIEYINIIHDKDETDNINDQQDVPIDEMRILTSRFDFVIYKFSVHREIYFSGGRKEKRGGQKEERGGRKEKTTPCPP